MHFTADDGSTRTSSMIQERRKESRDCQETGKRNHGARRSRRTRQLTVAYSIPCCSGNSTVTADRHVPYDSHHNNSGNYIPVSAENFAQ
ncbi:uncharacterized protein [Dermacentor albipictus]|uniref:uncharacterized protein isoform X2 n=1 Tax=Dermacentor albipictus TaxID=60249 RepID=UPI0038FC6B69